MSDEVQKGPEVLLLDMGNTFMFGCDRFDDSTEIYLAYRELGGRDLAEVEVAEIIAVVIARMSRLYVNPAYYDRFPSVRSVLDSVWVEQGSKPEDELALLEETISRQEAGHIPDRYVEILRNLRSRYRLGVVSNVWSRSAIFRSVFETAGVSELFDTIVFSSDGNSIKPSSSMFNQAIAAFPDVPRDKIWFVGDDARCDIEGAAGVGLQSVWINPAGMSWPGSSVRPVFVSEDLGNLVMVGSFHDRDRHEA